MTPQPHTPLRRFTITGLLATIDAYTTGTLPLHRYTWELTNRLATLAEHTELSAWRTLATLRTAHHTIATINHQLTQTGRTTPTPAETHTLTTATTTLRKALTELSEQATASKTTRRNKINKVIAFPTRTCTRRHPARPRAHQRPSAIISDSVRSWRTC